MTAVERLLVTQIIKFFISEKKQVNLSTRCKGNRSSEMSGELGDEGERSVIVINITISISTSKKCRSNVLGVVFRSRALGSMIPMEKDQVHM